MTKEKKLFPIEPPGQRNGLKKYQVDSAIIKEKHGQTSAPEYYGHGPTYVSKDNKGD